MSLPEFERFLTNNKTTRKDLNDLAWLVENPEYEERIVDIRTFIDSPKYLNASKECWPSLKDDVEELFNGGFTEAVFCEGIGSGKSYKSSIIIAYMVYQVLCLKNPQDFFGLARDSQICFINMSIRADQSRKVVFGDIKSRVDNSPWFREKYPPDPSIRSELRFPKEIIVFPGNSKETFPLGFNILGGVMDEAAWYTDTKTHDVAEDMFNALHNRTKNRFGNRGLLVMISSPRYVDDFIEKKIKEAESNPNIFIRRKKVWESKPSYCFSGEWIDFQGYKIPKEYEIEARRSPDRFKRDYMAVPSLAVEAYIKQWDIFEKCIDDNMEYPFDDDGNLKNTFRGKKGIWYFMHIDLSWKRDATGIAMAHCEDNLTIVDFMLQIKAPPNGEIKFSKIRDLIFLLVKRGFNLVNVTYDGWQSIDSRQILFDNGVNTDTLSVDRDTAAYDTLKEKMYEQRIKFYRYEPFLSELKRLELKEGNKIDHPPQGAKDVADAVAGAVLMATDNSGTVHI